MDSKTELMKILMDINPDIDYETTDALVDNGDFDSLEVMSIVIQIEGRFHIEIDPDDVIAENFNSVDKILSLIEKGQA